jgi:ubiquinone/menaquinone biosynthesis C-methylase UbiE
MLKRSPVVQGQLAKEYAKNYYEIEDHIHLVFEQMDTPFLDKRIKPSMKVFDAMMGRGRHAIRYAKRGCNVWGNDLNPHMVEIAKRAARTAHAKLKFSVKDATNLKGVPSNSFDVTYAMYSSVGTIPGSRNRQAAINEMARVTKKGGLVIIHAHNFLDCFFSDDFCGWAIKSVVSPGKNLETGDMVTDYNGLRNMFNHYYTPGDFRRSFSKAGVKVIEEHYMSYDQKRFLTGIWKKFQADGFIFVGKKR